MKTANPRGVVQWFRLALYSLVFFLAVGGCEYILPNKPPFCEKTSPADNAVYSIGALVPFKVNAYDVDGTIAEVVFKAPGVSSFSDKDAPYEYNWPTTGLYEGAFVVEVAALDNDGENYTIQIPVRLVGTPMARAGRDTTITTAATTYMLQAESPTSGTGTWAILSGSGGQLSDTHSANATLTGLPCQTYILRWTVTNSINQSSDDVMVRFMHMPSAALAGTDQFFTDGRTSTTLEATAPAQGTGRWKIHSGGEGTFGDTGLANSTFQGLPCTAYKLVWTVSTACAESADTVEVRFEQFTINADAGADQYFIDGRTAVTLNGNTPSQGTGTWSVVGGGSNGTFNDPNNPKAIFSGLICQSYVLRWTITTACGSRSDELVITFDHLADDAVAGPDIQLTGSTRSVNLNANIPASGNGLWTIVSGNGGLLENPADPKTRFTGQPCQTYLLRWTVSTPCDATSDQLTLVILDYPSQSNAGPDQHLVDGSTMTELNANLPLNGTGRWSIISGGDGSFSDPNDPHAQFSGLLCHTYVLRWTISTACESTWDEVIVVFNQVILQADAGEDQKFTDGTTSTVLQGNDPGSGMSGTWTVLFGTGGTFANANDPTTVFNGESGQIYRLKWSLSSSCAENSDEVWISFLNSQVLYDSRDGRTYLALEIGDKVWMAENLNYPAGGSYAYANTSSFSTVYGRLYEWNSASLACPSGWHLPSDAEWRQLEAALGMDIPTTQLEWYRGTVEGGMLKESGNSHWHAPNTGATNISGFNGLPGGYRTSSGVFGGLGSHAGFWTSTTNDSNQAVYRALHKDKMQVGRDWSDPGYAFSVRCVKN